MKKYKALNLYNLSIKKGVLSYEWYLTKNKYIVKAFLITNNNRKQILNWILKYATTNLDVTKKILDTETKYIVGLFDIEKNTAIEILFWKNKEILEKFNKKISSNKYKHFFEKENNLNNEILNIPENINLSNKDNKKEIFSKENLFTISWNKKILNSIINNELDEKDFIQNENELITTLHNLEKNISNLDKNTLLDITKINYPFAMNLKKKEVNELNKKKEFENNKKQKLNILRDY